MLKLTHDPISMKFYLLIPHKMVVSKDLPYRRIPKSNERILIGLGLPLKSKKNKISQNLPGPSPIN